MSIYMYYFSGYWGIVFPSQVGQPYASAQLCRWNVVVAIQAVRFEPDRMHKVVIMLPMRFIMRLIFLADRHGHVL